MDIDILKLSMTPSVLKAKRKDLKASGLGNKPNKASALTEEEEEKLWVSDALGSRSPESLLHALWYLVTKLLGFRGCQEARQLMWGDFAFKKDSDGIEFVEWHTERETKTRKGVGSVRAFTPKLFPNKKDQYRCPVNLMHIYECLRPASMLAPDSPFFLAINYAGWEKDGGAWYKNSPMGRDRIGKIMGMIAKKGGLSGKYSNHSVRRTACTQLLNNGVAPLTAAQLTGHKDPNSLQHYFVANEKTQKQMSAILQGGGDSEMAKETTAGSSYCSSNSTQVNNQMKGIYFGHNCSVTINNYYK